MRNRSSAQTVDKVYIIRRVFYSMKNKPFPSILRGNGSKSDDLFDG